MNQVCGALRRIQMKHVDRKIVLDSTVALLEKWKRKLEYKLLIKISRIVSGLKIALGSERARNWEKTLGNVPFSPSFPCYSPSSFLK